MIRRLAALLVLLPAIVSAQAPLGGNGYLFKQPRGSLTIRGGAVRPNASGGIFDLASSLLMPQGSRDTKSGLGPSDYFGLAVSIESALRLGERGELVVGASLQNRRVDSEYRQWTDNKDLPIEQFTRFNRVPVSVGYKFNLRPAGRAVSRLAWVPTGVVPYVAAGGGAMYWSLRQEGDFVDFQSSNLAVFRSVLKDKGWAPLAYAATGATWSILPTVALTTEARFDAARAPLRGDFSGFKNIGLSGVGVTAGVQLRY